MPSLLSFEGRIGRFRYGLLAIGLFFSQHLLVALVCGMQGRLPRLDWTFVLIPMLALREIKPDMPVVLLVIYVLLAAWMLAALSFRRAADAQTADWVSALTIAPIVQIPALVWLCAVPSSSGEPVQTPADVDSIPRRAWAASAQGVIAGAAVTLAAVAVSALLFGAYGFGIFMASPFVVGLTTAFFANRPTDIGAGPTVMLALFACLIGGSALIVTALEGIVCLVLASPIAGAMASIGALLGHAIAARAHARGQTFSAVAVLPLVFAIESALPPSTRFETRQRIVIDAPPTFVWQAIVSAEPIAERPSLPFRLGVAYPLFGKIERGGVDGIRRGHFSTGIAIERITEWEPDRRLAFKVLNDIPAMREMSPYQHVHAPHVIGYFRTLETLFELNQLTPARTELIEKTSHELRLNPVPYWLPLARIIVDQNNARVMRHVRDVAMKHYLSSR
jgi:hypothetical protein